jgi:hypothetical protein
VPRLTIIIPALGRQEELDETLVSVLENRPADCEVLVPHGPTYRDPYDLSDEVRFVPVADQALLSLIRTGLAASQAPIVHVLQSGFRATPGWTEPIVERFVSDVSLAAVSPRVQLLSGRAMHELRGIRYHPGGTRRDVAVEDAKISASDPSILWEGPSLQAGFFRRCALSSIGGLDPHVGSFYCDVDTIVKLRRTGWHCDHESASLVRGRQVIRPAGFLAGRQAERLFWRHRRVFGPIASLRDHLWITSLESWQSFPRPASLTTLCGRIWGLAECAAFRRHAWIPTPSDESAGGSPEAPNPNTIPIEHARRRRRQRMTSGPAPSGVRHVGS